MKYRLSPEDCNRSPMDEKHGLGTLSVIMGTYQRGVRLTAPDEYMRE